MGNTRILQAIKHFNKGVELEEEGKLLSAYKHYIRAVFLAPCEKQRRVYMRSLLRISKCSLAKV